MGIDNPVQHGKSQLQHLLFSPQQLSQMLDQAPVGILLLDSELRLLHINPRGLPAFSEITNPVGRLLSEIVTIQLGAKLAEQVISQFKQTLETGESFHSPEFSAVRHDTGAKEYHDWKIDRLTLADGSYGIVCYFTETGEQMRAQQSLRENEQKLRATFNQAAVGMAIATLDGRFEEANAKCLEVLGYTSEELYQLTSLDITHPDDRLQTESLVRQLIAGEVPAYKTEKRYIRKDGGIVWSSTTVTLVKDEQGQPLRFIAVIENVTHRRLAEQSLHARERELSLIYENVSDGIFYIAAEPDGAFRYMSVNRAFLEATGLQEDQVVGKTVSEVNSACSPCASADHFRKAMEEQTTVRWEAGLEYPSGGKFAAISVAPVRNNAGKCTGLIGTIHDITKAKNAEEQLRHSEQELRALANSIPQLAWMAEPDGHIFWYNHGWFAYTGTTMEQMEGWGWQSVHDPAVLPDVIERWQLSIQTGEPFEMEFPLRGADGNFRWFLTRVNPLRDSQGRVTRWFGTNTDINDVRVEQNALKDETQILELLNNSGTVLAAELDLEALVQRVTDAATELSGARFGAFFYKTWDEHGGSFLLYSLSGAPKEAFEKFGHPRATQLFGPTFEGKGPIRCNDVLTDSRYGKMPPHFGMPEGHLPVRSYLAVPVISRGGSVLGGLFFGHPEPGVFSERTERIIVGIAAHAAVAIDNARLYEASQKELAQRKRAENALRESEERLRAAIAATGTGTFRWFIDSNTLELDEALRQLFGLNPDQNIETMEEVLQHIHPVDQQRFTEAIQECIQSGSDFEMEYRVIWPDGTIHWLEDKGKMFPDESGKPLYMIGACVEVTSRKLASAELERARDAALEASRAKSTFLANMSHELRTPLNAIIGYSELLEDVARESELHSFTTDLKRINSAGKHLLSLISDILDLSKIEAGKMEIYASPFDVFLLVQDVTGTVQVLLDKHSNLLSVDCPDDIGRMVADETKVRQIIYNLVSNAAKFTEKGAVSLQVFRSIFEGDDWINFRITDTGIGMTAAHVASLFRDFTQVDPSTTRRYGGTGLGLAISRRFCRMMGGDINVSSDPGAGSVFTARIPAQVKGQISELRDLERSASHRVVTLKPGMPNTVLVIDDEPDVQDLLRRMLEKEGYHVVTANDGHQGIELARLHKPVAITLDIMMPGFDGWSVLSALKSDPIVADIPVVVVSIIEDRNLGFSLGAVDYVTKPIERKRLLNVLGKHHCDLKQCRVLIVDDDPDSRELMDRLLTGAGCRTSTAHNGLVAIEVMESVRPDLILLDLMMPEMDGFGFLRERRRVNEWRNIPVVVVTAKDLSEEDRQHLDGQVAEVLLKTQLSQTDLLQEIRRLLPSPPPM